MKNSNSGLIREPYFTSDTIEKKSSLMFVDLKERFGKQRMRFQPDNSALVVLDMQKYFLDEQSHAYVPSAAAVVGRIRDLVDIFWGNNLPVIFTRHIDSSDDSAPMARWWRNLLRREDPQSELVDNLDSSKSKVIEKSQYDAFFDTELDSILKDDSVKRLVITGVMTHLCCETTARSAFVRGYDVFFCIDGTATYNEDFHRAALLNLSHGFAVPVLVSDIMGSFVRNDEN